ncbi:MAG: hypothetical protein JSW72_04845 [Candidatus Bathyarchaeota archaeon]|nr:MAG: hypothetical protein JSW72_04845 [Candidatus Bathyarchaeota archaeon]
MKNGKNILGTTVVLAILATSLVFPVAAQTTGGQNREHPEILPHGPNGSNNWTWIKTDTINLIFPAGGRKPMFLWWYAEDPSNIYALKYKGLIEFMTFATPYYQHVYEATEFKLRTALNSGYFEPSQYQIRQQARLRIQQRLMNLAFFYGLHKPYLPFGACEWSLSGPVEVPDGSPLYLSFNFTLVGVPFPNLKFAENNVIIRCRFYLVETTEDVGGFYTYSVGEGELKMDLIVKNWTWNLDLIQPLLGEFADNGIEIPTNRTGLALWMNLASISLEKLDFAEQDIDAENGSVETQSMTQNMYVEGAQVSLAQNNTQSNLEEPLRNRANMRERFRLRFATPDASLAGFFKYVPKALVYDDATTTVVDVRASYISAGSHMRLFLAYPYFGNKTLEHDPSLGLEIEPTLLTSESLLILVGSISTVTIVIAVYKWKRKTINIVGPN